MPLAAICVLKVYLMLSCESLSLSLSLSFSLSQERLKSAAETRVGFVQALVRRIKRLIKLKAAAPPFTL